MAAQDESNIPEEFYCALTKKIMKEPMVSRYGTHFERDAIMGWLQKGNKYCPVTGQPLRPSNLVSDKNLQWKIQFWAAKNGRDDIVLNPQDEESAAAKIQVTGALPPKYMICPITKSIMKDPVMTKYGDSYEREALMRKLDKEGERDPRSGKLLLPSDVCTNHKLAFEIQQWNLHYGEAYDEMTRLEVETKTFKATMISQGFQTADILKALVLEHAGEEKDDLLDDDDQKMSAADVINAFDEIDDIVG
ncbi:U-box domain containing protein [Nitzschia inconspicua]|uniref:U-box domain containing protein n=1 Tax=Nitzschia inconspicua TaxID=303405 RepID=A0A9K3KGC1_9STRA|nr:U-box domain containing protein [Nitzschia inconspicua]